MEPSVGGTSISKDGVGDVVDTPPAVSVAQLIAEAEDAETLVRRRVPYFQLFSL